jgi:NAD(P)-dependent dehydrogenase (short-subunit alcohol dehydrogenase family)
MTSTDPATDVRPQADVVALVTGANKGIGYEVARLLGEQGATVLVGARDKTHGDDAARALQRAGIGAHHVQLDVTDQASIDDAAQRIEAEHGRLDVLVNNAGITGAGTSAASGLDADDWGRPSETTVALLRTVYETNVFGVVAVTNAMLPLLRRAPAARIVNVSSEVGSITSTLDPAHPLWELAMALPYPTSKTALNMVTALYAKELWDTPIKVNAANPGYCATDLNDHRGFRTAAEGAEPIVHLATLGPDGPSGTFYGDLSFSGVTDTPYGPLPW